MFVIQTLGTISYFYIGISLLVTRADCSTSRRSRIGRRKARHVEEGSIRLIGGLSEAEGNVEIFHAGLWGTICDDEWDDREAIVICKHLGFHNASVSKSTQNSQFGKGRRIIWMDNLYCDGHERRIEDCKFDGWGNHDCSSSESAGVICNEKSRQNPDTRVITNSSTSLPDTMKLSRQNKNIELRLMGGRHSSEGRVEIRFEKNSTHWSLICGDGWGILEANVVCQHLGFGYGQTAVQSSYFGGRHQDIIITNVQCTGLEKNISSCMYNIGRLAKCPGNEENIAGVICAKELPDLVPDELEVERSAYLEDRQLLYLQCAMEENCLASAAYSLDKNEYGWMYEQRRLFRFSARIGNIGTADFVPFLPKHAWQWHMCHLHYHSMEVFAHFDILNLQGNKVAEGHKASFCLEDSNCLPGVVKKFVCANYGDQGISVGCTDTYLHNIDCQWVDITDLQPGIYQFKMSINPELKIAELNYENNAALCTLYYNAVSVRLFNCTLTRP